MKGFVKGDVHNYFCAGVLEPRQPTFKKNPARGGNFFYCGFASSAQSTFGER